jgi:pimeloyl-ACP methyl ester carboxylesterase
LVVASSGGAEIAVALIRRHPDGIRGAVLSEPPLFALDQQIASEFGNLVGPAIEAAMADAGGDRRAAVDGFFTTVCPGLWSQIDETRKNLYRDNVAMLFAGLQASGDPVTIDDLARIRVASLVLSGSISHPGLRAIARKLAASIPDCRFLELQGSGHVTYAERPAEFAKAVESFADELAARA